MAVHEDLGQRQVLCLSLFFRRLLLLASNSNSLSRRSRVSYAFASLIWFTSIDGIHSITQRNLAHCVIGNIFVFARSDVSCPRHCTEEAAEHVFGMARQKEKEFTVRGFVQFSDQLQQFFDSAFRSGIHPGGRGSTG